MKNVITEQNSVDRIQRFQSLQAGEYWTAKIGIPGEAIISGDTLLLLSVRYVDNIPHTIILRSHPRHYGQYVTLESETRDGKTTLSGKRLTEHRFLVNDFLYKFEFQPDHQKIRESEIAAINAEVAQIQLEMNTTLTTPALMRAIVEQQLIADEEAKKQQSSDKDMDALLPAVRDDAVSLVTGTVINALGSGLNAESISSMKQAANREHRIAEIQSQWLAKKNGQMSATLKKIMPYFDEMPAAALAKTEDVRTYVDDLQAGIQSLYLYTGENVEVVTVRQGKSASSEEPLTLVQRKLVVDEELSIWADIDENFDVRDIDVFFDNLRKHSGLIAQIFPSERCVLVMATTHNNKDYGDPWTNNQMKRRNREVFLMIRDGENIYQVFSPVESHLAANRLFPSQNEAEQHFRGIDGTQIKLDDIAYTDRLSSFELAALHYKRFLILLCGLDHRLSIFGEFYDGPPSMNFVSLDFQEKHCRFLHDDDGDGLLAAQTNRPGLSQYIKDMNAYARSGSRVLCNWYSLMTPQTAPGACKEEINRSYISYYFTARPDSDYDVSVIYRKGPSLLVDVQVSRDYSHSKFNCKVDLTLTRRSYDNNDHQLPYLCLDAIDPDDLEWYVQNRQCRKDHVFYIRFFKTAIRYIRAERLVEAPVRKQMEDALIEGKVSTPDEYESLINQSVIAWRAGNRGANLSQVMTDKKAWKSLLNQMYHLAGNAKNEVECVEEFVNKLGYNPLRLVVGTNGKLAVYAEPSPEERDDRLEDHVWVHRINIIRGQRNIRETGRRWAILPKAIAAETPVHQWAQAVSWIGKTSIFSSFNAKQKVFDRTDKCADLLRQFSGKMGKEAFATIFMEWCEAYTAINLKTDRVIKPELIIPVGYMTGFASNSFDSTGTQHGYILACIKHPEHLLYKYAPDDESRQYVLDAYAAWYKEEYIQSEIDNLITGTVKFKSIRLCSANDANITNNRLFNVAGNPFSLTGAVEPASFSDSVEFWKRKNQNKDSVCKFYFSPKIIDKNGKICADEIMNNRMPEDYKPVDLVHIRIDVPRRGLSETGDERFDDCYTGTETKIQFFDWFDICDRSVLSSELVKSIPVQDVEIERLPFNNVDAAQKYIRDTTSYHVVYRSINQQNDCPEAALPPSGVIRMVRGER